MKMRLVMLLAALMLPCSLACAADSFLGKWQINIERSYVEPGPDFHAGMKVRRGSARFTRERSGYDYEMDAEFTDGDGWHLMAPATFDDRVYPGTLSGRQIIFTARRAGDRSFKILNAEKQTGKVTEVFLFNVSSDDKTLVFTALKPDEKTPSLTLVYDRQ